MVTSSTSDLDEVMKVRQTRDIAMMEAVLKSIVCQICQRSWTVMASTG